MGQLDFVDGIVLIARPQDEAEIRSVAQQLKLSKLKAVLRGGVKRQDSVFEGLSWIEREKVPCEYVFIHDGVRPFASKELIEKLWEQRKEGAVVPVLPVEDTLKMVEGDWIQKTLDRGQIKRVQTPQLYEFQKLRDAYTSLNRIHQPVTDESSVFELQGLKVKAILGEKTNIKITTPEDLLPYRRVRYSVGQGIDVHAFEEKWGGLVLGGVSIPDSKSLKGHSDADVVVHSLCDGLLGAAGLSDIGTYFPDNDPQYDKISSLILLEEVMEKIIKKGYEVEHVDITILAEAPKLQTFIPKMKMQLRLRLKIKEEAISIKATTTEQLGYIGRQEGIASHAMVTLRKFYYEGQLR